MCVIMENDDNLNWHERVEQFMVESRDRWRLAGWVFLCAVLALVAGVLWMPMDIRIRLPGEFRPALDRMEVATGEGGTVARVYVRDGDRVVQGQPLIRLERQAILARSERVRERMEHLRLEMEDVRTMGHRLAQVGRDPAGHELLAVREMDWLNFEAIYGLILVEQAALAQDLARARRLWQREVISRMELDQLEQREALLLARKQTIVKEHGMRWAGEFDQLQREWQHLSAELSALEEQLGAGVVQAPADGVFVATVAVSSGKVLMPGQSLGFVSPESALVIEARALPAQLPRLRESGEANVSVHALPSMYWGTLSARLDFISGDRLPDGTYRLILHPEQEFLRNRNGQKISVRRGMTTEVRLLSERRRVWSALLYNAGEWLQKDSLLVHRGQ